MAEFLNGLFCAPAGHWYDRRAMSKGALMGFDDAVKLGFQIT
jgi:hypothetical protein